MDPLLLEALRFGVAIIAGGIVAVTAQRIAFRHAQRLQQAEREQRHGELRRALASEIRENLVRLRPPLPEGLQGGVVVADAPALESAWAQARGIELSPEQRDKIGRAYGFASSYNNALVMLNSRLTSGGGTIAPNESMVITSAAVTADRAAKAFDEALIALGEEG